MKEVERTNTVIVHLNQWAGFASYNLYAMDVDRRNRNCYNYRGFKYLARNYRNRRTRGKIGKED